MSLCGGWGGGGGVEFSLQVATTVLYKSMQWSFLQLSSLIPVVVILSCLTVCAKLGKGA